MPTLYRAVNANPPTAEDFTSNKAKGKPRREPYEREDEWAGISTFDTEARCRAKAADYDLGTFIAEVDIPDDAPIRIGQVNRRGHCTIWGDPDDLLRYVTAVTRVQDAERQV
ncbi:MAG: hypothetical protein U0232_07275 [Thermomicrobiales bacterium]